MISTAGKKPGAYQHVWYAAENHGLAEYLRAEYPRENHIPEKYVLPPEIIALVTAGVVYWLTIYPRARLEIRRWRRRAQRIPDLTLRAQALYKLTFERLNPEAAAFFAVLAPWRHRRALVRLMVDFQIAYDYLDAINEEPETALAAQRPAAASGPRRRRQLARV